MAMQNKTSLNAAILSRVPDVMAAVVKLLGMLVSLTLLSERPATCQSKEDDDYLYDYLAAVEDYRDKCSEYQPKISATTNTSTSKHESDGLYCIKTQYGEDVIVYCAGTSGSYVRLRSGKRFLHAEELSPSKGRYRIRTRNLSDDLLYKYNCVDNQTNCESITLVIRVIPLISISSSRVQYTRDRFGNVSYFVPYGQSYDVFCTAQDGKPLIIDMALTDGIWKRQKVKTVNSTTVKHEAQAHRVDKVVYSCSGALPADNKVAVAIDHYPAAVNFSCINYFGTGNLVCTWNSSSTRNTFYLFYMNGSRHTELLCSDLSGRIAGGCKWHYYKEDNRFTLPFSLQLQSCNRIFCDNKTFSFKILEIIKLKPPSDFKVINITSHGATVAWSFEMIKFAAFGYIHRLEYRMLGTTWRLLDASSTEYAYGTKQRVNCRLQISLPCPDEHYELRLYVKIEDAADDRYWSEPTSLFFVTVARASDTRDEMNPECNITFRELGLPPSIDQMIFDTSELMSYARDEKQKIKKQVQVLEQKLAKIQVLSEILSGSNTD